MHDANGGDPQVGDPNSNLLLSPAFHQGLGLRRVGKQLEILKIRDGEFQEAISLIHGELGFSRLSLPNRVQPAAQDLLNHNDRNALFQYGNKGRLANARGIPLQNQCQDIGVEGFHSLGSASRAR